jgi:DNA transformation protein
MALDPERAQDIFSAFGPVTLRRMFGGTGIYAGGVMFALEARETLYLKADASTQEAFEAEGCGPFSYEAAGGRRVLTSYRRIPDRLLDEPDELAAWARRALAIAEAATSARKRRR